MSQGFSESESAADDGLMPLESADNYEDFQTNRDEVVLSEMITDKSAAKDKLSTGQTPEPKET